MKPEPIARTETGTPVYQLTEPIPDDVLPKGFGGRGRGALPPNGPFAKWLGTQVPVRPACIIVQYKQRYIRIFRVWKSGEVFSVTARAIRAADRKRLIADGILRGS